MSDPSLLALTIRQPYAAAVMSTRRGRKSIENRSWSTDHRGPLVIHSGTKLHDAAASDPLVRTERLQDLPMGYLLGVVDLVGVCEHVRGRGCSRWAIHGQYHWRLERPRPLPAPIRWRGGLGLWRLRDPDALRALSLLMDAPGPS